VKFPFIQCFTGDWLKDPAVSMLSPAARGIWWDFICVMHESDRSGMVTGSRPMLARLVRCSTDELGGALNEFQLCKTAEVNEDVNGIVTVINRRMRREAIEREMAAKRQERHREKSEDRGQRTDGNNTVTALSRDILQNLESESEYSDKACKPLKPEVEGRGTRDEGQKLNARQIEVAAFAEDVLNGEWVNDAGKWIGRIKTQAEKVFRVMADVHSAKVEGRVKTSPARMAEFNWGVFK
jgi:hypothetical protein